MRSIINLITIAFVIGAIVFAVENPTLQKAAKSYVAETKSELSDLTGGTPVTLSMKSITDSFSNLMNIGQESTDAPIPQVVTPGPLTKIPTDDGTTTASSTATAATPVAKPAAPLPAPVETGMHTLLTGEGIISQTNAQRAENGVAALSESTQLDASAEAKAQDILARQYFEHTAPDGKTVSDLVAAQGYTYIKIGENLALGDFTSDSDVVTAWMNSPGHRANILDPEFQQIGVGVAYGMYQGQEVYVAVQHFGRPSSDCPSISDSLKSEVESGQASLTVEANDLQAQKAAISAGEAQGQDETKAISDYDSGVDKYQSDYAAVETIRTEYNDQVAAFNQCIAAAS